MPNSSPGPILPTIRTPQDLRGLSIAQLLALAQEIREAICSQVSVSGGHLAPNLGVVELTIALHYVFDFAHDRLLFDVGHQCYPHKLLTGRLGLLSKLRTREGMAGFPEPRESEYDLFSVGHAGTGIPTAVGMARGDVLNKEAFDPRTNPAGRRVVTLIGDASIVNGVALEGLNNAGTLKRQFLVVLNDNGMSISKPQGALAHYFDRMRLSHIYTDLKKSAKQVLKNMPGGGLIKDAYHAAGEATKAVINEGAWFEQFGLLTVGPIDGHDIPTLIQFFREARDLDRPMVLHVKTIKGKGYKFAEQDASKFHSPGAFKVEGSVEGEPVGNASRVEMRSEGRSFTTAFADALSDLMEKDPKIVTCTAAMPDGTGLNKLIPKFPERAWDVGICESHAMDMMAGLAKTGFKPFFAVYCTFLQRAFDQAFQEVALQGLPVRLCLDRAGLVGGDGAVHHGFCDVSLLRTLPGAVIMAAIDEPSLKASLEFMRNYDKGLSAVRYPRDKVSDRLTGTSCPAFELGKACRLTPELPEDESPDVAVLAFGTLAITALEGVDSLAGTAVVEVYDARFAKPVDQSLIRSLLERHVPIITVEDHGLTGGFGSAVVEAAAEMGLDASLITRLGLPDSWVYQDSRARQLAEVGLDVAGMVRAVRNGVLPAGMISRSGGVGRDWSRLAGVLNRRCVGQQANQDGGSRRHVMFGHGWVVDPRLYGRFCMKTTLNIQGMHCQACVAKLELAFSKIAGVTGARVTLNPPRAEIESDVPVSGAVLEAAARSAGNYSVASESVDTQIEIAAPRGKPSLYPLWLIIAYIAGATLLAGWARGNLDWHSLLNDFMAGFFLVFSFFKLLDLRGFADAYRMYDLVARAWRPWGFIYPFVELALGAAYLARWQPNVVNAVTLVLMLVGAVGVLRPLLRRQEIRCACLGTALNLPMTTVTLVEDLAMAAMGAAMLLWHR